MNSAQVTEEPPMLAAGMRGWVRAWAEIARRYGQSDVDAPDPSSKECWQYMGSFDGVHQFRHRGLQGRRVYEDVAVADGDFEAAP